jgi:acyl carrier protein
MSKQDKIREIVAAVGGKPVTVGDEESLFENGILDSFAMTDLVNAIETAFSIRIPDADARPRKFETVDLIAQYLDERGA